MDQSGDSASSANRTNVEEVIIGHLSKIQEANKLKNYDDTYDFIIEHWFMYDAHWLAMVRHMKENGRLQ